MCSTCGCGEADVRVSGLGGAAVGELGAGKAARAHGHAGRVHGGHQHEHRHDEPTRTVLLEQDVLARNDALAARNRDWLAARRAEAVNLMSSPGSGKTTLLERTVQELGASRPVCVVEGDQETLLDADRIRATGCPVVQINTGAGCHLDAAMLQRGLAELDPAPGALVLVENVGNLVCPALFDLGESRRVVVMSVTEGADKPAKYPHMFATADLVLVNKVDLLPYVDFDVDRCERALRLVNPAAAVLHVSATRGDGLADWFSWLGQVAEHAPRSTPATGDQ